MFSRVRIAIRFFFVGLAVGILLAPRSGDQTRQMLREKADRLLNEVLDAATLGTAQTSTDPGGATSGTEASASDEPAARGTGRSNGGTRSRSRAASSGAGAGSSSSS